MLFFFFFFFFFLLGGGGGGGFKQVSISLHWGGEGVQANFNLLALLTPSFPMPLLQCPPLIRGDYLQRPRAFSCSFRKTCYSVCSFSW